MHHLQFQFQFPNTTGKPRRGCVIVSSFSFLVLWENRCALFSSNFPVYGKADETSLVPVSQCYGKADAPSSITNITRYVITRKLPRSASNPFPVFIRRWEIQELLHITFFRNVACRIYEMPEFLEKSTLRSLLRCWGKSVSQGCVRLENS
jgi:hypothetical protein